MANTLRQQFVENPLVVEVADMEEAISKARENGPGVYDYERAPGCGPWLTSITVDADGKYRTHTED